MAQTTQSDQKRALVKLEVKTEAGVELRNPNASLIDPDTNKQIVAFHDSTAEGVPYGVYVLRIREPGFKWHEQRIEVNKPDVSVRLHLTIADILDTVRIP